MRVAQDADASGRTPMRKKTRVGYGCCDVGNSREKNIGEGKAQDFHGSLASFSELPISVQVTLLKWRSVTVRYISISTVLTFRRSRV